MSLWHHVMWAVPPSLLVHLEIQSTFLLVSGMVCVCVSRREREKEREKDCYGWCDSTLRFWDQNQTNSKTVALETGFSAVEAASGRPGLRKPRLPSILYLMLITFATGESVPKPPGRPSAPSWGGQDMTAPSLPLRPADQSELEAPEKRQLQGGRSALPFSTYKQSLRSLWEGCPTPPFLSLEKGSWSREWSARRCLFTRITLLSRSFPPYTSKSLSH